MFIAFPVSFVSHATVGQKVPLRERQAVLSDFSEGMLGKLLVRRSGRVQLKLGDNIMDVSEGAAFSFLQVCIYRYKYHLVFFFFNNHQ